MKKVIINENQRGFLFKNGRYQKMLGPGKYHLFGDSEIEIADTSRRLIPNACSLETLLADKEVAEQTDVITVGECEMVLILRDGCFMGSANAGKHAFWRVDGEYEFVRIDMSNPELDASFPMHLISRIASMYYRKVEVSESQKAIVYFDKKLARLLDAGTYYFWRFFVDVDVDYVDTCLVQKNIPGQEMLTADKVSIRINLVCSYRVTDCVKCITEIDDYEQQLYVAAQLALREYVGKYKLDELLENKDGISDFVLQRLKEKESGFYVEVTEAGVKDIILPGEIREIMNTVLVAEKRAQANVISRREEVASTRSLLNTAKLMDENQTLYKLKELEYVERICENVGNITLNGNGDVLSQLVGMLRSDKSKES